MYFHKNTHIFCLYHFQLLEKVYDFAGHNNNINMMHLFKSDDYSLSSVKEVSDDTSLTVTLFPTLA